VSLRGSPELRARLRAIKLAFKPLGKAWADDAAAEMRRRIPKRTGATAASIRRRNATQRKATVVGSFVANFIDAGTKEHTEVPRRAKRLRFQSGGRTIFARKVLHPRTAAHPFKRAAALEALRKNPMAQVVIDEWNRAAR
jgi:hypothetical protein